MQTTEANEIIVAAATRKFYRVSAIVGALPYHVLFVSEQQRIVSELNAAAIDSGLSGWS